MVCVYELGKPGLELRTQNRIGALGVLCPLREGPRVVCAVGGVLDKNGCSIWSAGVQLSWNSEERHLEPVGKEGQVRRASPGVQKVQAHVQGGRVSQGPQVVAVGAGAEGCPLMGRKKGPEGRGKAVIRSLC